MLGLPLRLTTQGGVRGLSANADYLTQWSLQACPTQNSTTGIWESPDKTGDREGEVLESNVGNFDGIDDYADFTIALANRTFKYFDGTTEQTDTTDASGHWQPLAGKYGDVRFYDIATGLILEHSYHIDESDGTTLFDSVGSINATINNATLATFWTTDNGFKSYQNELGYTDNAGQLIPAQLDSNGNLTGLDALGNPLQYKGRVKYPLIIKGSSCYDFSSDVNVYVTDLAPLYSSIPDVVIEFWFKRDGSPSGDNECLYSEGSTLAANQFLRYQINISGTLRFTLRDDADVYLYDKTTVGTYVDNKWHKVKVIDNNGDYIISIDDVELFNDSYTPSSTITMNVASMGVLRRTVLSQYSNSLFSELRQSRTDGTVVGYYKCSENGGPISYNTLNTNHGNIIGATLSLFHSTDDLVRPNNMIDGFDKWEEDASPGTFIYVPFDINGNSIKTDGDTIAGYTWVSKNAGCSICKGWNGSENTLEQYPANETYEADLRLTTPFWYTDPATVIPRSFTEIPWNYLEENIVLSDKSDPFCTKNLLLINRELTFKEEVKTKNFLDQIEPLTDEFGVQHSDNGEKHYNTTYYTE